MVEWPFAARIPRRTRLLILDDFFPELTTGFRLAEFHFLAEHFRDVVVLTSAVQLLFHRYYWYAPIRRNYAKAFPERAKQVFKFNRFQKIDADAAYLVFLNNAFAYLDFLERNRIPFLFTLYPGGGFILDNAESDTKLERILGSPFFSKVIVTQRITRDYLLTKGFCPEEKIHYVYGGVAPRQETPELPAPPRAGGALDICFVAARYMPQGLDKGYDIFIEACKLLKCRLPDCRFHVVGPFTPDDWELGELAGSLTFHGFLTNRQLAEFFRGMQIIVAPNRAFTLRPGAFDGFPTGSCVEAALAGVAVFCTDPLDLNDHFVDGRDLVLINHDPQLVADRLYTYCLAPARLQSLRCAGQARFAELYAFDAQMKERIQHLEALLDVAPRCTGR